MKSSPATSPVVLPVLLFAVFGALTWLWMQFSGPPVQFGNAADPGAAETATTPAHLATEQREDRPEHTGALAAYHAPVGSRLTYRFETRTGWAMVAKPELDGADDVVVKPTSDTMEQGMTMRGRMILTVAARRADEVIAQVDFQDFAIELPQGGRSAGIERLRRATEKPTLVRMKDTGAIVGYRFQEDLAASQCNLLRGLLASFQFVVPDVDARTWECESTDSAGRFRSAYRRVAKRGSRSLVVTRAKLGYVAPSASDTPLPESSGDGRATIDREFGWLVRADFDERLVQSMPGVGGKITVTARGTLDLVDTTRTDRMALADREFDSAWAGLTAAPARMAAEAEADELAGWARVLRKVTFDQLLAELERLIANQSLDTPDAHEVVEALSWLVRVRPDALAKVEGAIRRSAAGGELDTMLMWSLTKAGSPAAQDVLAAFLADASEPARRDSAALAMVQLAAPGETVMGVLTHQVENATGTSRADRMSMLLLGTLAPRSRPPKNSATKAEEPSAIQTLLAQEKNAIARGLLSTWLEALGNAGTPAIAPRAMHYLTHNSAPVRQSAASALREVRTAAVRDALLRVARRDAESSVRVGALGSLRGHDLRPAFGLLRELATGDRSPDVRRVALLRHAADPKEARTIALLKHIAGNDPLPELQKLARRLLRSGGD